MLPNAPVSWDSRAVSGSTEVPPPANVSATSRSFHTHRNWKMANEAMAGVDSGSTIFRKMRKWLAPSTRAASIRSRGSCAMKLCSRNTASGSANIVCAIHTGRYGHLMMESFPAMGTVGMCTPKSSKCPVKSCSSGSSAICSGTTCSAKMAKNTNVLPRNGTQASAYAAIDAIASGNSAPGIVITNEFTKNGTEPPRHRSHRRRTRSSSSPA